MITFEPANYGYFAEMLFWRGGLIRCRGERSGHTNGYRDLPASGLEGQAAVMNRADIKEQE